MSDDSRPPPPRTALRRPEMVCAAAAIVIRAIAGIAHWTGSPALRNPHLDALYYLDWAREIAGGAWTSAGPAGAAEPYLLNPLYAWMIAPLTVFGDGLQPAVLVVQALLGGGTAWLAAAAARRHGGGHADTAAWVAGGAVAASAALVHLATHVSVATLAAFLVAGACFAFAPAREEGERGHGGSAAGLWLGIGALARPVTMLAVPFAMVLHLRRSGARAALAVAVVFGLCTAVSLGRNLAVTGEFVPFTAANGLNLHLGQNPLARATDSMLTDAFQFTPIGMHDDARIRVGHELGREPTRGEVSAWFRDLAVRDMLDHPGAALVHGLNKTRWFASPEEPPSSADMDLDRKRVPLLHLGFVPTWLLVVAGIAGAWAARRDRALLLGAGGLVLAHVASTTLSFPLSHYRAPAIPALAVLAGAGVAVWRSSDPADRLRLGGLLVLLSLLAWIPPQPGPVREVQDMNTARAALADGDLDDAEQRVERALRTLPAWSEPLEMRAAIHALRGETDQALARMEELIARRPWDLDARRLRAELFVDLKRNDDAVRAAEALVTDFPWSAAARGVRGSIRAYTGDIAGAREDLAWAMERGFVPQPRVARLAGIDPQ